MNALVLEGGGIKGAYQLGAFKALKEEGIEFKYIAGTSIGAINGAFFCLDKIEELENIYRTIEPFDIFNKELKGFKNIEDKSELFKSIFDVIKAGGLDISSLKKMIDDNIDEKALKNAKTKLALVTVSVDKLKSVEVFIDDIEENKVNDYILASAYLPVFKGNIDGERYLDGGFYNNLPISVLKDKKDIKNLYIIKLNSLGLIKEVKTEFNEIIIEPKQDLGALLDFNRDHIDYNIKLGYFDALRKIKNYDGYKYVLKNKPESYFFNYFSNITKKSVDKIIELLDFEQRDKMRVIFERIIPFVAKMINEDNLGYEQIGLYLYENYAINENIDRFKEYDFLEFIKKINLKVKKSKVDISFLDSLKVKIAKHVWINKEEREEILLDILRIIEGGANDGL